MKFYTFCMQTSVADFSVPYGKISNNELNKIWSTRTDFCGHRWV